MRGLDGLLYPCTGDEFLRNNWPAVPYAVHGAKESVRELTTLPFLASLDALLAAWPRPVQAHLPDLADEASAVDASPSDARKLFRNRMSLLFNDAQDLSPVLKEWLRAIGKDLGLPAMTHARCMVYATPDGKGTAAHFDQNVNFVLQLHGTKTWRLAPNEHVENPTQRHTLGQPLDPELATYVRRELPARMPKASVEFELKPGSVLFVPRGFWHRTEASGEALALNFTFNQPTWIDLFTAALRSRLSLSTEWRELADGVSAASPERRARAAERFGQLLEELKYDLPGWRAEDILGATEGETPPGR
jgi:50S ribosomal protein L16 3-hydroxylase